MPDIWLLTYSFTAAAVWIALASIVGCSRGHSSATGPASAPHLRLLCGFVIGILAGLAVQGVVPALPPVSGLDRWLLIGLPLLLCADATGARWLTVSSAARLRLTAALVVAPVILYGSVHVEAAPTVRLFPGLTAGGMFFLIAAGSVLVTMTALTERFASGASLFDAALVILTLQVAAATVMLGGWIRGGAAALPFAGSGLGVLLILTGLRKSPAAVLVSRWGVWSLCGVVLLGHFFGRLSVLQSLLLLAAPVSASGLPLPRRLVAVRFRAIFRCLFTGLLLALVLIPAIVEFLQRMRPLLSEFGMQSHRFGS
ncbi:MAG UNVERIFIED_CONTAM: hypothetical protein LVR18_19625 [Planctomycetaceae bacterium]|jgi:hypothetical protein